MIFLDDKKLRNGVLYKKNVHLPINKDDKRRGAMVFLLSPDFQTSLDVLTGEIIDYRFYSGYYIEKDITYYINQEDATVSENLDYITEGKLSAKERNSLSDSQFGVSSKRSFPLNDESHVRAAIKMFNHVEEEHEKELAAKIKRKIKSMGLSDINIGDDNRLKKYIPENTIDINFSIPTYMSTDYELNEEYMRCRVDDKDILFVYPENGEMVYTEAVKANNPMLKKILWAERYKTPKDVIKVYDHVESEFNKNNLHIDKMFVFLKKYRQYNLFSDLSFYNQTFFKNNIWKMDKGVNLYFDFITRLLKDPRYFTAGYIKSSIIIPVFGWTRANESNKDFRLYTNDINPISMILRLMHNNLDHLKKEWAGMNFLILGKTAFFKLDIDSLEKTDIVKIRMLINKLIKNDTNDAEDAPDSADGIKASIIDKIEKSQSIEVKSLTGDNSSITKAELVDKIDMAASVSDSEDTAIELLDKDADFKELIAQLGNQNTDINMNAARTARMEKLNDEIMQKKVRNTSLKELINYKQIDKLPVTKLNLDTINPEWESLTYTNFDKSYNIDADIAKILAFFNTRSLPVAMRNIKVEDTSSTEDWIYTYTVECEDYLGQRFTLKFDIPKFKDNRYMYLRGNEKILNGQLMQIPISKTEQDTVQIVSNYNKIFIRRFGSMAGKSGPIPDRIIKTINKMKDANDNSIKVVHGDNRKICSKYNLPFEYIDLSSEYSRLETKSFIIYFNQDEVRKLYKVDEKAAGIPCVYDKKAQKLYNIDNHNGTQNISEQLLGYLNESTGFAQTFDTTKEGTKYCYSQASVLNTKIPVIVIMAYHVGLIEAMKKGDVDFSIEKLRTQYDHITHDAIKFKDGMIIYRMDYNSNLLMNGLKECDTLNYSLSEIGSKEMYLDFLDGFGGRIKADGLDNFYDLMLDPITEDVINIYNLPTDYVSLLAYGNKLLEDNKFIKHTDLSNNRYRSNEIIAGLLYNELANSYGVYRNKSKRTSKGNAMSIKQSAVIDALLLLKTSSDASILNALLDVESMNSISFKGLSGMNADRAYDLDKRTYDKSMINILGLSTGFAGNVGITRQATIDMNVEGGRGLLKVNSTSDDVGLKSLCMSEAITPYSINHDDQFRQAMTFIQTSKHFMRTSTMNPRLITNGADEALPYMASNTFAFKSAQPGKVLEKTDEYMILEYKDGSHEYINLEEKIVKNSSGGFFGSIKLDSDYKEGSTFKSNEIIAYDKQSFSSDVGATDNLTYNAGTMCKIAIMYTDEGIEDSAMCTEWLADALSSDVIVKVDAYLNKSTNVYSIVSKGQKIEEGEQLISFQEAVDDEDVNSLMKALGAEEDEISDLGRINKKSKYTGEIADIKVYRTVELDELSDSLKKIVRSYEKEISDKKSKMRNYKIDQEFTLDANNKLPATGKLKNVGEGVLIEFYIRYFDKFSVGDKLIYDCALKGVLKTLVSDEDAPYSEFRPNEQVSTLASLSSLEGRMVSSLILNGQLNKILIELDRSVKEKLGIPWKPIDKMNK